MEVFVDIKGVFLVEKISHPEVLFEWFDYFDLDLR